MPYPHIAVVVYLPRALFVLYVHCLPVNLLTASYFLARRTPRYFGTFSRHRRIEYRAEPYNARAQRTAGAAGAAGSREPDSSSTPCSAGGNRGGRATTPPGLGSSGVRGGVGVSGMRTPSKGSPARCQLRGRRVAEVCVWGGGWVDGWVGE